MRDGILKIIKENRLIEKDDKVIIGVSGGPDSICLLHILYMLSKQLDFSIVAVHVNHMLRGKESDLDEQYVKDFCANLKIDLFICHVDISKVSKEKRISLEEAGREERYRIFNEYSAKINANKIAIGHNKNDQAETILMNIIRGTGIDGLKGMGYKKGNIIRPLLENKRSDIEEYCLDNTLCARVDSSNLDMLYTRNKVRNALIPWISENFSINIVDTIYKMSLLIKDDANFMQSLADDAVKDCIIESKEESISIDIKKLNIYNIALKRRVLRTVIINLKGSLKQIESIHIESIIDLCNNGKTGATLHLPEGLRVKKSYETVKIFIKEDLNILKPCNATELTIPGNTYIDGLDIIANAYVKEKESYKMFLKDSLIQGFDYGKLNSKLTLRTRQPGDFIKPLGFKGTKKLKKYFIDEKVERDKRDEILLLSIGHEILWIIGYNINDKYKVTKDTKKVLMIEIKNDDICI